MSGGSYNLKSTLNYRFLWNLFMAILFTHRVFARNWQTPKKYFFILRFVQDVIPASWNVALHLIKHHTTYWVKVMSTYKYSCRSFMGLCWKIRYFFPYFFISIFTAVPPQRFQYFFFTTYFMSCVFQLLMH